MDKYVSAVKKKCNLDHVSDLCGIKQYRID